MSPQQEKELRTLARRGVDVLLGPDGPPLHSETYKVLHALSYLVKSSRTPACLECQGDTRAYTDEITGTQVHFCNLCGGRQ